MWGFFIFGFLIIMFLIAGPVVRLILGSIVAAVVILFMFSDQLPDGQQVDYDRITFRSFEVDPLGHRIEAIVQNDTDRAIDDLTVELTLLECTAGGCESLGSSYRKLVPYRVRVVSPGGMAKFRTLISDLDLPRTPLRGGNFRYNYRIVKVRM